MATTYFTKQCKEGEEVLAVVKRSPISYSGRFCIMGVLVLLPFFLLYPLFRAGAAGIAGWFALLLIAVVYGARVLFIYAYNALLITDQRVVDFDQKGFFHRAVSETAYGTIQDVTFEIKGVLQTFFHFGNIDIQTAGAQKNLEIEDVANPERIQDMIMKVKRSSDASQRPGTEGLSADELVRLVNRIKDGIGEEAFEALTAKRPPSKK